MQRPTSRILTRHACRFTERLLRFDLGVLIVAFRHRMGEDKAAAHEHHCDSHPMAEALARRIGCFSAAILVPLLLSHRNLLFVLLCVVRTRSKS